MSAADASTFDSTLPLDNAHADARRSPEATLQLPLWQRDRSFLLTRMAHATALKPGPSSTQISQAIVNSVTAARTA